MKTYNVDYIPDTTKTVLGKIEEYFDSAIAPIFDGFNNLTYLGLASYGNYREMVFKIGDYTNFYLSLPRLSSRTDYGSDGANFFGIRLRASDDLTVANTYITTNIRYGGAPNCTIVSSQEYLQNFYVVTDEDNNLRALWQPKGTASAITYSQGILITEDEDNRDVVCILGDANYPIYVLYLDDSTYTAYYIPTDSSVYESSSKLIKKNWMPITTSNNINSIVNALSSRTVRIFNTSLGANENQNSKDSSAIRKLIQVGDKKYRQIVSNYWIEDSLGDETPISVTN